MRLIIASDKMTVVNARNVKCFSIDVSENNEFWIVADGIFLSSHSSVEGAKKEFQCLLSVLSCPDSFLYRSENSNG